MPRTTRSIDLLVRRGSEDIHSVAREPDLEPRQGAHAQRHRRGHARRTLAFGWMTRPDPRRAATRRPQLDLPRAADGPRARVVRHAAVAGRRSGARADHPSARRRRPGPTADGAAAPIDRPHGEPARCRRADGVLPLQRRGPHAFVVADGDVTACRIAGAYDEIERRAGPPRGPVEPVRARRVVHEPASGQPAGDGPQHVAGAVPARPRAGRGPACGPARRRTDRRPAPHPAPGAVPRAARRGAFTDRSVRRDPGADARCPPYVPAVQLPDGELVVFAVPDEATGSMLDEARIVSEKLAGRARTFVGESANCAQLRRVVPGPVGRAHRVPRPIPHRQPGVFRPGVRRSLGHRLRDSSNSTSAGRW